MEKFLESLLTVLFAVDFWVIYKKMGREGYEGIIPVYKWYVLFEELYGNGWKFLLYLVPFYNVYLIFKVAIDIAHGFHKSTAFGFGCVFIAPVFYTILAFDNSVWRDGSEANKEKDFIDDAASFVNNKFHEATKSEKSAADKLKELKRLYDDGILTEEEYEAKRKDLVDKI